MSCFIGIDPGVNGALVALEGKLVDVCRGDLSVQEVWGWLCVRAVRGDCFALIEQQTPRPTRFQQNGVWVSTVLASTCVLYGNYERLKGLLVASEIPFEDCPPKRWQEGLKIPAREKGETDGKWKGRLRRKATELFPKERVTLATCDALLIAEYARRCREGTLAVK